MVWVLRGAPGSAGRWIMPRSGLRRNRPAKSTTHRDVACESKRDAGKARPERREPLYLAWGLLSPRPDQDRRGFDDVDRKILPRELRATLGAAKTNALQHLVGRMNLAPEVEDVVTAAAHQFEGHASRELQLVFSGHRLHRRCHCGDRARGDSLRSGPACPAARECPAVWPASHTSRSARRLTPSATSDAAPPARPPNWPVDALRAAESTSWGPQHTAGFSAGERLGCGRHARRTRPGLPPAVGRTLAL